MSYRIVSHPAEQYFEVMWGERSLGAHGSAKAHDAATEIRPERISPRERYAYGER